MSPQQRKLILGIGGGIIALIIILILVTTVPKIGKVEVDVQTAPKEATLTINGQKANPGKQYLAPGEYTLKVSLEHFTDTEKKINTNNLKPGDKIFLLPKADSEAAEKWLLDHPEAAKEMNIAGDSQASAIQQEVITNFPLVQDLPHESTTFRVDYSINTERTKVTYHVTLLPYLLKNRPGYKEQLLEFKANADAYLKSYGLDLSKESVTYTPDPATVN